MLFEPLTWRMSEVNCDIRIVEVPGLTRRMTIWLAGKGVCEGFVIHKYGELATLNKISKMFYCQVDSQELSIKSTVTSFRWFEALGKSMQEVAIGHL